MRNFYAEHLEVLVQRAKAEGFPVLAYFLEMACDEAAQTVRPSSLPRSLPPMKRRGECQVGAGRKYLK